MVTVSTNVDQPLQDKLLRGMFEARKRVFVDLLKWDVPVLDDRFELDQFDDDRCVYLVVSGARGEHLGSARLLETVRPHILDSLFAHLVAGTIPRGPGTLEITRFCLDRNQGATQRLATRNRLVTALVEYALANGISTYTGVAEFNWLQQILAFGWRCRPLGLPMRTGDALLGALQIEISEETPSLLRTSGIWMPDALEPAAALEAA